MALSPKAKDCSAPPPNTPAEPPTLAEILDRRIPHGDTSTDQEERENVWKSLVAEGSDSVGLPEALAGLPYLLQKKRTDSRKNEVICVLESLIPGITDFKPEVKLAFQAVRLWEKAAGGDVNTRIPALVPCVRKADFQRLLLSFRQIVELATSFKEADILDGSLLVHTKCSAALPTLKSWGISEEDFVRRVPEGDRGIKFDVFALWAVERWLEETMRVSSRPPSRSAVTFEGQARPPRAADGPEALLRSVAKRDVPQIRRPSVEGGSSMSGSVAASSLCASATESEADFQDTLRSHLNGSFTPEALAKVIPAPEDQVMWVITDPMGCGIRTEPSYHDAARTGEDLTLGEVFGVDEEKKCAGGVIFLHLADGRGWCFNKKPGIGTTCVRQAPTPSSSSSPKAGVLGRESPTQARSTARSLGCTFPTLERVYGSTGSIGGTGKTGVLTSLSRHRSMPKYGFGVRAYGQPPEDNPGPGSYDTHDKDGGRQTSKFRAPTTFSWGGGDRFGTGANPARDKPGPGAYGVPHDPGKYQSDTRVGFPGAPRGNAYGKIVQRAPGPGAYPMKGNIGEDAPAFSAMGKPYRTYMKNIIRPGPGSYDPAENPNAYSSPTRAIFGTGSRQALVKKDDLVSPGPGAYDLTRCNTIAGSDAGKFSIVSRRKSHKMDSYLTPGPGMYDSHHTQFGY